MRFAFWKERIELRQVASFIYVFLRLVPGCWFHMQAKRMQAPSISQPRKWARVAAQAKGTLQKAQGCPCCSAASM